MSRTAERERVAGLLYDVVRGRRLCPPPIERKLHDAVAYTALQNRQLLAELAAVLAVLDQAQIPTIVLKGAALVESIYGNIGLRPMVDLDLLVHRVDVVRAIELLGALGYTAEDHSPHPGAALTFENETMLVRCGARFFQVELHWSLFDSPHHQAILLDDWLWQTAQHATVASRSARILGPEALILHLCGHLALHHTGHSHLLWLNDIAEIVVAYRNGLDWKSVAARADSYDLVLSLRYALNRVVELWHAPVPREILNRLEHTTVSRAEERVLSGRLAGPRPVLARFWDDLAGLPTWRARVRYAGQNLFPSRAYMRRRYRIPHPALWPFTYPYRWYLGLAGLFRRTAG